MEVARSNASSDPLRGIALAGDDGTGGRTTTPGLPPESRPERLALGVGVHRVWAPVLLRAAGAGALLVALAGIGVAATRTEAETTRTLAGVGNEGPAQDAVVEALSLPRERLHESSASTEPGALPEANGGTLPALGPDDASRLSEAAPTEAGLTADGKVILNTANAAELERLPGIGPARATAILALRARLKKFRKPTDLLRVRGIGQKTLKRMLPHLVVDPPPPAEAGAKGAPPSPPGAQG